MFGCLVLIPFLEGRRSPNGLDAQQRAEITSEEIFGRASSAVGMLVGLSQSTAHIARSRVKEVASTLVKSIPECDDHCAKNYAILISLAEKVLFNDMTAIL